MAGSDWIHHLPLVMLGLRAAPKDDSGFSPAKAVYGSHLSLPGEFIKHPEFPPEVFLRIVENAVSGFSGPPCNHVVSAPQLPPVPWALMLVEFVFVRDDASKLLLALLNRGPPYRVLRLSDKFFVLQIGDKSDSVSVDRLKPVYSTVPLDPAVPPL